MVIGPLSLVLLGVALSALIIALAAYPRKRQPLYRIDKTSFHDGAEMFYPMKRTPFGWKVFIVEESIRGYHTLEDARNALEGFLSQELNLEISKTETVKEYG